MWFKMGGANLEESLTVEASPLAEVTGGNTMVDTGFDGGVTLADGAPPKPVIDVAQTITDVRAASGLDKYIQPEIGGESKVSPGSVVGETIVVPGEQDPLVSAVDTIKREPQINTNADGLLAMQTINTPGDHIDEVADPANTITYEPIISTDDQGQLEQGLSVGVAGDQGDQVVAAADRKWKGRIPSGARQNTDPAGVIDVEPRAEGEVSAIDAVPLEVADAGVQAPAESTVGNVGDGVDQDGAPVIANEAGYPVVPGTLEPEAAEPGVTQTPDAGSESGGTGDQAVVTGESRDEAVKTPDDAGVDDAPAGPTGLPDGYGLGQATSAPSEPRPLTPEEQRDRELDEMDRIQEEGLAQRGLDTAVPPDAGTPPANADLVAALNSDSNPNAQDRIEPSGVEKRDGILSADAENQLRAAGVIAPDADGTDTIDAAVQPSVQEEVVPLAVEEPAATVPEATADEVAADAPVVAPEVEEPESVTESNPATEVEAQVNPEAGDAVVEKTVQTNSKEGTADSADSAQRPVIEETMEPTADPASAGGIEDLVKPAEKFMSMNLAEVEDRIGKVPAEQRLTQIKFEVVRAMKDKMEKDNIKSLGDIYGSVEEYNNKIKEMTDWLEFMTATSEVVNSQDDSSSSSVAA